MLTILKLIQSIFKTLHSAGTPNQVAWGIVLGAGLAFIPMLTLQYAFLFILLVMLNVSFGGGMIGLGLFLPVSFLLDPLFDALGRYLLITRADLAPLWTRLLEIPLAPYTELNNTVTLGATLLWVISIPVLYVAARAGITKYRASWGAKLENSKFMKAIKASKVYNVYSFFTEE